MGERRVARRPRCTRCTLTLTRGTSVTRGHLPRDDDGSAYFRIFRAEKRRGRERDVERDVAKVERDVRRAKHAKAHVVRPRRVRRARASRSVALRRRRRLEKFVECFRRRRAMSRLSPRRHHRRGFARDAKRERTLAGDESRGGRVARHGVPPPAPVRHGPSRRARRRETRRANVLRHAFVVRFSAIATRSFKRRGSRFPLRHQLGILLGVLGARRRERGRQQGRLTAETPREGTVVHLGDERPDDAKRKLRRVRRRVAIDRVEGSQPAHGA